MYENVSRKPVCPANLIKILLNVSYKYNNCRGLTHSIRKLAAEKNNCFKNDFVTVILYRRTSMVVKKQKLFFKKYIVKKLHTFFVVTKNLYTLYIKTYNIVNPFVCEARKITAATSLHTHSRLLLQQHG